MLHIRKTLSSALGRLPALVFAIVGTTSISQGAELKALVTTKSDGSAKVKFQPTNSVDNIAVRDRNGNEIGKLNWAASFELEVTEKALREATTKQGIDLAALLKGIGTIDNGGEILVAGALPRDVKLTVDGVDPKDVEVTPAGTEVFFSLERLTNSGSVAPTVALGGAMGPGGAANNFNDKLLTSGVKERVVTKAEPKVAPQIRQTAKRSGVHGDGNVPLDALNSLGLSDQQFLSSPTCVASGTKVNRISSYYGRRQQKKALNGEYISGHHDGIDISATRGTPVVAAASGCVRMERMTFNPGEGKRGVGYGISLVVDHGNGFTTQYGHMQNFSPKVQAFFKSAKSRRECMPIERGEQLGNSGMTGRCTAPHLHFGMSHNGKSVNPQKYMIPRTVADLAQTCEALASSNEKLGERQLAEKLSPATSTAYAARASGTAVAAAVPASGPAPITR